MEGSTEKTVYTQDAPLQTMETEPITKAQDSVIYGSRSGYRPGVC
jgi:hypothetical protein